MCVHLAVCILSKNVFHQKVYGIHFQFLHFTHSLMSMTECGRINRITGAVVGEDVQTNEFPWITEILYQSNNWCHGSLINSRYVLTTAWCVGERFESNSTCLPIC